MAIKVADRKEKRKFFKTIKGRARKKGDPFSIMFELTYKCNFRCPHCYLPGSHKEKRELSTEQIFSVLEQLKGMGVYNIGFSGGEPLVRRDIFDILDYAYRCGFKFGLLTNGYSINEKIADRLKKVNVIKVDITFNSLRPEVFDKLSGVGGSFGKVKNSIEILKKKNIRVAIKSICISLNKDELVKIGRYARALNILYRIDGEVLPCRNGCVTRVNEYSLEYTVGIIRLRKKLPKDIINIKLIGQLVDAAGSVRTPALF